MMPITMPLRHEGLTLYDVIHETVQSYRFVQYYLANTHASRKVVTLTIPSPLS